MRKAKFSSVFVLLLPCVCLGWGADGHRIIAQIADSELTPQARAALAPLLDRQTLADISTWADEIRRMSEYDWSAPLHYVNLPPQASRYDATRDCPQGKCVVEAITKYANVLRDPKAPLEHRIEALKFLVHFVGDIHQPLHVSHAHDKGGNDVSVDFFYNRTNLHRVWDSEIIRRASRGRPWQAYEQKLAEQITPQQKKLWSAQLDPAAWAEESYRLAVSNAYAIPKNAQLGEEYMNRNRPVVDERLLTAGVRLGALLNELFSNRACTTAPATAPPSPSATGSATAD